MLLNEFFGSYNFKSKATNSNEELKVKNDGLCADVLEYIINNDSLHKNVFFPIAEKLIKEATKEYKSDVWMPLANKGCMSFYKMAEMKDNPTKIFPEEFRKELCEKLAEHYQSDILKGLYKLGK
jgi:uncharacterized protein YpiB (UPF0302 family)